jgi:hypothetical protein
VNNARSGASDSAIASLPTGTARIFSMKRTPSTSCRSSAVVIDTGTSGPNISRDRRRESRGCRPSTAAARPGKIVPE